MPPPRKRKGKMRGQKHTACAFVSYSLQLRKSNVTQTENFDTSLTDFLISKKIKGGGVGCRGPGQQKAKGGAKNNPARLLFPILAK